MSGGSQSEGASNSASPASSVTLSQGLNNNAPKYGTLVPNRIFVGGISSNTTEAELCQLFSKYGNVKATKIIADRAGVSKGYGFVTFESEEEVKGLIQDANSIVLKERRLNIAPAIKKQPFTRSFDASSPPPTTPNLFFHNGVPYTFHNGMAFFPPTAHQPALATMPSSMDPSLYSSYGPTQNAAPGPYGTPVLLPAPPPVFMPQNYSYQPMPMTNGNTPQFIYTGSGSSNSSSPMASTPENSHLSSPLLPQFYSQQYAAQEAYFPQPIYVYSFGPGDYEAQDQLTPSDDCSSTVSTPHSEASDRSNNRSPTTIAVQSKFVVAKKKVDGAGPNAEESNNKGQNNKNPVKLSNSDSQVPVVSWQSLKNHAEERELRIRDGRRAFHPVPAQPPPPPQMFYQQQSPFSSGCQANAIYQQTKQKHMSENSRSQGQNFRACSRYNVLSNNIPFIPKFPASFNNNNPSIVNKNFQDQYATDNSNSKALKFSNTKGNGGSKTIHYVSSPSNPKPSNSFVSSPSPQMMPQSQTQHFDRQYGTVDRSLVTSTTSRWSSNPQATSQHQIKRLVCNKRQSGSNPNLGVTSNNSGSVRLTKKIQEYQETIENDIGGGGDAQPLLQLALTSPSTPSNGGNSAEISSKMQSLSLGNHS